MNDLIFLVIVDYYYNITPPKFGAIPNLYYACETMEIANNILEDIANKFVDSGEKIKKVYDKYMDFTQVVFEEKRGKRISIYIRPNIPMYR